MTDLVFARWTCTGCGGEGVVSGERADTTGQEPGDPAPFNCYFCQVTVAVPLPAGLDRWHLRVEGAYGTETTPPEAPPACPRCSAEAKVFWDGRDAPLVVCTRCGHCARQPEPVADPSTWEVLLESREEKIERRRGNEGWEFRSESYFKDGSIFRSGRRTTVLEGFEPDPGRPLSQIFREIRQEHARLREEALAPPPAPPASEG